MSKTTTYYVAALILQARKLGLDADRFLIEKSIPADMAITDDQWIDNRYLTTLLKSM